MNIELDLVGTVKLVLVILMFLGFIWAWIQISKAAKDQERVLREGRRVLARIVALRDGPARKGKQTEVILTLEYDAPPEATRRAQSSVFVGPVLLRDVVVGASVHAIVDRSDPQRVIVEIEKGVVS